MQKKGILSGALVGVAVYLLFIPFDWEQHWLKIVAKILIVAAVFAGVMYVHARVEARRALARHAQEDEARG